MDYDISYYSLLFFFLPGLLLSKLDLFYGADRRANFLNQFYNVLIAGTVSYGIVGLGYWVFDVEFSIPFEILLGFPEGTGDATKNFYGVAVNADNPMYPWITGEEQVSRKVVTLFDCIDEVAWAVGVSYIVGAIWLKAAKHKILGRSLQWLKVTDRFSEYDVWTEYLNTGYLDKTVRKTDLSKLADVRIWNDKRKLVYFGKLLILSDYDIIREVILVNVEIFRYDENLKVYGPPRIQSFIYLSFSKDDVWMEFPKKGEKKWHA